MGLSAHFVCLLFFYIIFAVVSQGQDPETKTLQEADIVCKIPGQPPVDFKQYAGYVTVDEVSKRLSFTGSLKQPKVQTSSTLAQWSQSCLTKIDFHVLFYETGPGCSSVGFGEAQELGPFLVTKGSELKFNNYTWNKAANLLFLEAPAGVGFSYSNKTIDTYGDNVTAQNLYTFLLNWFKRFPQYKSSEFYIAGESYADRNALLDDDTDQTGMIDYAWGHALISDKLYSDIKENCDFSKENYTKECLDPLVNGYYGLYSMNIDMRFYEKCHLVMIRVPKTMQRRTSTVQTCKKLCTQTSPIFLVRGRFAIRNAINNGWNDSSPSILPVIKKLIDGGLRVWVYSGDTDGRVPVTSTRYTLNKLGLNITQDSSPWHNHKQIGGLDY
ncbi:hypothetical protein C5167_034625 [Papaver somniferum]|uniref:Carboxypeptidase n=1 Tax=Papaver somniferum TaxID=3469 RepID=A0A4Y7KH82_PAPSO|nr:hypothetical protein C5167_034625 [Papaver somniferum]